MRQVLKLNLRRPLSIAALVVFMLVILACCKWRPLPLHMWQRIFPFGISFQGCKVNGFANVCFVFLCKQKKNVIKSCFGPYYCFAGVAGTQGASFDLETMAPAAFFV